MNTSAEAQAHMADGAARSTLRELLKISEEVREPVSVGTDIGEWLYERYVTDTQGWKRRLYYSLKPLIPRPIQIALRQRYVGVQAAAAFPAWPIEPLLTEKVEKYLRALLGGADAVRHIAFWPGASQCAFVITHDVELDAGLRRAPALAALEQELGFTSCWNLVPERYPIDWGIVNELRQQGFEIGIHGLKHDGRLFQSHALFTERMKAIERYAGEWGAEGFRSPSTLRNAVWMSDMQFSYDSSFPDTDPYEPQPGGCCSIWPYFLGPMVELPLSLPQDHTLFEILQHKDIAVWKKKIEWIAAHGGIAMVNVHPDYMLTDERLSFYRDLLLYMKDQSGVWHVQPREAARWWRDRQASRLRQADGKFRVEGPAGDRAVVVRRRLVNGSLVTESERAS
jgi:peptidoglycan/xylan/chitin deacetylase (PgdA/CDA1 family)